MAVGHEGQTYRKQVAIWACSPEEEVWGGLAREWQVKSWGGLENLETARRRKKEAGRGLPGKSDKEEVREVSQARRNTGEKQV